MRQWSLPYCKANTTHTSLPANATVDLCRAEHIVFQAHSPLGGYFVRNIYSYSSWSYSTQNDQLQYPTFTHFWKQVSWTLFGVSSSQHCLSHRNTTATSSRITRLLYSSQANSSILPARLLRPLKCSFGRPRIGVQGSDFLNWKFSSSEELIYWQYSIM